MSKQFRITPEMATDMAQLVHNEIDLNGQLEEEKIIDCLCDQYGEWLWDAIDWQKILDDDAETREYIEEREEAAKGEY